MLSRSRFTRGIILHIDTNIIFKSYDIVERPQKNTVTVFSQIWTDRKSTTNRISSHFALIKGKACSTYLDVKRTVQCPFKTGFKVLELEQSMKRSRSTRLLYLFLSVNYTRCLPSLEQLNVIDLSRPP